MNVLLIEANPADVCTIQKLLAEVKGIPFDLECADRLSTALARLVKGDLDVLLLDLFLPDSQGLDTLVRVHAEAPGMPIVVLTDLDDEALAVKAVREGAQNYLVKEHVGVNLLVGSIYYAIERKRAEAELAYMTTHDALTGLPNRALFHDRLKLELAHAYRKHQKLAVMWLDLDHFKDVNDTLGHKVGDWLLQAVGERLRNLLRESDTVARMGGDEFMLICPDLTLGEDMTKIARRILDAFRKPFMRAGHEVHITTSVGIAIYPYDGEEADTLMRHAEIAMHRAKDKGRNNYQRYTPAPNDFALSMTLNSHEDEV
jgi:diguanylate cyclase (GGDEF)-like protein